MADDLPTAFSHVKPADTQFEDGWLPHQKPGITHYLFDYSPDMKYLEIVSPVPAEGFAKYRRSRPGANVALV